jgi:hypothetical protein
LDISESILHSYIFLIEVILRNPLNEVLAQCHQNQIQIQIDDSDHLYITEKAEKSANITVGTDYCAMAKEVEYDLGYYQTDNDPKS